MLPSIQGFDTVVLSDFNLQQEQFPNILNRIPKICDAVMPLGKKNNNDDEPVSAQTILLCNNWHCSFYFLLYEIEVFKG